MPDDNRYVKPQSAKEAMELIQKLFNSYRNAPLTSELLNYHTNLVARLNSDILLAAKQEGPKQVADLKSMVALMQSWTRIRLSGRPFLGKMHHFKLSNGNQPKFKRRVHKMNGGSNHRASRHWLWKEGSVATIRQPPLTKVTRFPTKPIKWKNAQLIFKPVDAVVALEHHFNALTRHTVRIVR